MHEHGALLLLICSALTFTYLLTCMHVCVDSIGVCNNDVVQAVLCRAIHG